MGLTQMIRRQPKWLIPPIIFWVAQWCWQCPAGRRTPCSWIQVSTHVSHEGWIQYQTCKDSVSNSNDHGSCMSHVYMKWLQFENTNDMTWMLLTTFSNAALTIYNVYHNCCTHDAAIFMYPKHATNMEKNMVNCVLAITELMWLTVCDQSNSNLDKTNNNKLSASLCSVAMVCILPASSKISSRMKCAFGIRLQSVNVVGSLKFTQTYHDH